jgi:outer membrane biosynthesis protein TonB
MRPAMNKPSLDRTLGLAVAALAATILSGCGGSTPQTSSPTLSPAATETSAAEPVVVDASTTPPTPLADPTSAEPTIAPSPSPTKAAATHGPVVARIRKVPVPVVTKRAPAPAPAKTTAHAPSVYYKNCAAAKAAGVAPLHLGEPGYRSGLDRDGDGVACE